MTQMMSPIVHATEPKESWGPIAALGGVWVAAALIAVLAPDMVSGSQHEHLPLALMTVWLWSCASSAYVLMTPARGWQPGWSLGVIGVWLITAVIAIRAPELVTGTDPTRIPLAAVIAPPVAAVVTGMLCLRQARSFCLASDEVGSDPHAS
jgi:hypothetical protein